MIDFLAWFESYLLSLDLWLRILVLSLIPASLTSIGALPVVFGEKISRRGLGVGLGFSSGVMIVASFTGLLLPALDTGYFLVVYVGFILGVLFIHVLNELLPHLHVVKGYEGPSEGFRRYKRMLLVAFTVIIHNIPEGMAIGVSIIDDVYTGLLVAIAIGIQDIPEGFAVSLPYYSATAKKAQSLLLGVFSGFTELLAAYIPWIIIQLFGEFTNIILPFLMSFSAAAMIYVVVHELIPEIYGRGHDDSATIGFFTGFLIMLLLDTLLG